MGNQPRRRRCIRKVENGVALRWAPPSMVRKRVSVSWQIAIATFERPLALRSKIKPVTGKKNRKPQGFRGFEWERQFPNWRDDVFYGRLAES
jgi:hypothetical protein